MSQRQTTTTFLRTPRRYRRATKALEKNAQGQFERAQLVGEVHRREAWNPVTFRNVIDLLARRGILQVDPEGGRETGYRRGPAFDEIAALRERLAAALGSR